MTKRPPKKAVTSPRRLKKLLQRAATLTVTPEPALHADLTSKLDGDRPFAFLSYAREDAPVAEALVGALNAHKIQVSWDRLFEPGVAFDDQIEAGLEKAAAVVVLWSEAAVASRYVRAEAAAALSLDKVIPVHVEGFSATEMPFRFRNLQCCCVTDISRIVSALSGRGL